MTIEVSIQTNVALKGLQFQLLHTPFTNIETELQPKETSIAQFETNKLFEDLTLFPREEYKGQIGEKMLIDYANDISTFLDFDGLDLFLANEEYIISHQYSNLVMFIDTIKSDIHDDGMWLYVAQINSSGEDEILYSKTISNSIDIIELPIGQILRGYQNGSIGTYDGFKLMMGGSLYNYSILSIQESARIDIMYTK